MKSPLYDTMIAVGAQYAESDDGEMPAHFGNPLDEYSTAHDSAAIADRSVLSKIEIRGRDRASFLHNLCTNDIRGLATGRGCEAFLTNVQGKILYYVRVTAGAESLWIDTVPGAAASLLAHLDHYLITEKVELVDRTAETAQVLVIGPRAGEIVTAATGMTVRDMGELSNVETGSDSQLVHHTSLGLPAYEWRFASAQAGEVWRSLWQSGQPFGMRPLGEQAYEILRVEAGLPVYGKDINDSNFPQEVGRDKRTISFTKGCYLGQETIARIDALGHVNRHLVGLKIQHPGAPPVRGAAISAGGKTTGQITSVVQSPALNCAIALGYVRRGHEKPGTVASIDSGSTTIPAVVHALPFPE